MRVKNTRIHNLIVCLRFQICCILQAMKQQTVCWEWIVQCKNRLLANFHPSFRGSVGSPAASTSLRPSQKTSRLQGYKFHTLGGRISFEADSMKYTLSRHQNRLRCYNPEAGNTEEKNWWMTGKDPPQLNRPVQVRAPSIVPLTTLRAFRWRWVGKITWILR